MATQQARRGGSDDHLLNKYIRLIQVFLYYNNYDLKTKCIQLQVIQREFRDRAEDWIFEFVELKGGRTVAFVGNKIHRESACRGPNAFFVLKKD